MKLRVVLDTNVLVSGLLGGTATEVMRRWRHGASDLVVSEDILGEYEAVLTRPKFKLPPWLVQELLGYIRAQAKWAIPTSVLEFELRDPADIKFLRAALSGQADLVVSEDKDLLEVGDFHGVRIVPPWDLLSFL